MIKVRPRKKVSLIEILEREVNSQVGAVVVNNKGTHFIITYDIDYSHYVLIGNNMVQIYNKNEIQGFLDILEVQLVKLVNLDEMEITV